MTVSRKLRQFKFQGRSDGPHLLITGGVHGDEFEPIAAIRQLIEMFQDPNSDVSDFRGRTTFVPIVNEAAFLRGHRCADDGLDLARICPGRSDGSMTEQVASELSELIRGSDLYIDLHTGGTELSIYPLAGYVMHANADVLAMQRRIARAFNLPLIWGTAANLDGRSISVARDANIPAIYCEYLGSATCHADGVDAYISGCLNVMSEVGMIERPRPVDRVTRLVENPKPDSGHLQVCNPSPVTGYFEACVKLGDEIRQGEPLGTIFPLDGGESHVITAAQSGVVIVLRTFPRVRNGESIGVVMETPTS